MNVLIAGATGFIGNQLAHRLADHHQVRCIVRSKQTEKAQRLRDEGFELHEGDVTDEASLRGSGRGVDAAYYLVHSMGDNDGGDDFASRDKAAAEAFATVMQADGVRRVIYLGGLGDPDKSEHLRSRRDTARALEAYGPALTHFRASMIIGAQSDSYRMLSALVQRIPVTLAPAGLDNRTQPIGIEDTVRYLADALAIDATMSREIQIGGPDEVSYLELLDRMAQALGLKPRPKLRVPLLTPELAAPLVGPITPVEGTIARPLVEGLSTSTTVTDNSGMQLFDFSTQPLDQVLKDAVDAEGASAEPAAQPREAPVPETS